MSRSNIKAQGPLNKETYAVLFETRNGYRAYTYSLVPDGIQIAAGSDPRNFSGTEVNAWTVLEALGKNAEDVAELLA